MSTTVTPSKLRHEAERIVAAYDKAAGVRDRVKQFDEQTAATLKALDGEIAELDRSAGEDVGQLQRLLATREARRRAEARLAQERIGVLAQVKRDEIACHESAMGLQEFFTLAHQYAMEHAIVTLTELYENRARAEQVAGQTDYLRSSYHWAFWMQANCPASTMVQRLRSFVDGSKPLWRI